MKIMGFLGSFIGSTIGWYAGALVGNTTAFVLSMVGAGAGIYYGRRAGARLLP